MPDKKMEMKYSNSPTVFSDIVNIGTRSTDDVILIQFMSHLPDLLLENFRTMMTKEDAKNLVDNLTEMLNYYPVKKEVEIAKPKGKKALTANKIT